MSFFFFLFSATRVASPHWMKYLSHTRNTALDGKKMDAFKPAGGGLRKILGAKFRTQTSNDLCYAPVG